MLAIKNNLMAENAARQLGLTYGSLSKSVERLSSGLRINTAKDDAAGLAVSELIKADVAVLKQGSRNAQDGISMLQTAEGALGTIDEILVRMKELAEQAATESYSTTQRQIMDAEFAQLSDEIDRIAGNTTFNTINLLNTTATKDIHIGGLNQKVTIGGGDMTAATLGIGGVKESITAEKWVGSATAAFFAEGGTAAGTISFNFGAQDAITVDVAKNTSWNVQEFADAVNAVSRGTTEAYNAAEVVYDSVSGAYSVKISAKAAGNDTIAVVDDGTGDLQWGDTTDLAATEENDFINQNGSGTAVSIAQASDANTALGLVNTAIETKDNTRAKLGYYMNRLEKVVKVVDIQAENLLAAQSRITDVDVATEMAAMTRGQVLAQSGIAMLAQANTMPQMALQLLKG
jgi:flagellin